MIELIGEIETLIEEARLDESNEIIRYYNQTKEVILSIKDFNPL